MWTTSSVQQNLLVKWDSGHYLQSNEAQIYVFSFKAIGIVKHTACSGRESIDCLKLDNGENGIILM